MAVNLKKPRRVAGTLSEQVAALQAYMMALVGELERELDARDKKIQELERKLGEVKKS